jgi:hypothetical protein
MRRSCPTTHTYSISKTAKFLLMNAMKSSHVISHVRTKLVSNILETVSDSIRVDMMSDMTACGIYAYS